MNKKLKNKLYTSAIFTGGFSIALLLIAILSIFFNTTSNQLFINFPTNILYLALCILCGYLLCVILEDKK